MMEEKQCLYLICSPDKWYGDGSKDNYKVNDLLLNLEQTSWGISSLKNIFIGMQGIIKVSRDNRPKYFLDEHNVNKLQSGIYATFEVIDFSPDKSYGEVSIKVIKNLFKEDSIISKEESKNILGNKFDSQSQGYITQEQYDMICNNIDINNYDDVPEQKKELVTSEVIEYPRNEQYKSDALEFANFKCEVDEKHITFISKVTGDNYVEGHHLIPMKSYSKFDNSIDVRANIVSLCPTCHRKLHSGISEDVNKIIEVLYDKRADRLKKVGLNISMEELKDIYKEDI